jgi:uncharacterized protein with von Willebrand factor type A (vWA) domain
VRLAGRLTLCGGHDDLARFDAAFDAWLSGRSAPHRATVRPRPVLAVPAAAEEEPGSAASDGERRHPSLAAASQAELLRRRDLAELRPDERAAVARLLAAVDPSGPTRPSRRRRPARRGRVDPPRTVRGALRHGGEPTVLRRHAAGERPRRLVLLLDVSGSMSSYRDAYLRFAHACARRRPRTEVFTMGTRLTRVTRPIGLGDADAALRAVAAATPDAGGGTRLGADLQAFLAGWGRRGAARGAVVVLASDGWERGDCAPLAEQMAHLSRLAHRVVWVHPYAARPGFAPATAGLRAALPYVDDLVAGHSVAALEDLARRIARAGTPDGRRA